MRTKIVNDVSWRKGMNEPEYACDLIKGFARIKGEAHVFIPIRILHNRTITCIDREISRCLKNKK